MGRRWKRTKSSREKKDADKKPELPSSHTSKSTNDSNEEIITSYSKAPAGHSVTFYCLLENRPFDRVFKVEATAGDYVLDLRERIKDVMSGDLEGITASDLTLWSVSIPLGDNDALSQFKPQNDEQNNIMKLDKWDRVSTESPIRKEESLHIIVQFRQSNQSHVCHLVG
jgi:Crinkler effector protein N-terminal domain